MANNIKIIRNEKKLTQEALGVLVDCHWTTIAKLESGEMNLTQKWMKRLADAMECAPADFLPDGTNNIGDEDKRMFEQFRQLPKDKKELVRGMTEAFSSEFKHDKEANG